MFEIICACTSSYGIGLKGSLPWHIPEELALFRKTTENSLIVVGRKTFELMPTLPNRMVFVISKSKKQNYYFESFESAYKIATEVSKEENKKIFVIGGETLFRYTLLYYQSDIEKIHISWIKDNFVCDSFIPTNFDNRKIIGHADNKDFIYTIYTYKKNLSEKSEYLNLLSSVMLNGEKRETRNGITRCSFNHNLRFNLLQGFPLLTTKKMFFREIVEELLFFLRGDTDTKLLESKGINIWRGNTNRAFLDANNKKHYKEGEMGKMYGYQWRHFGSLSENYNIEYYGVDQLENVIELIKTDPHSRRIMMTDYNPVEADSGVLYPCHSIILQFFVQGKFLDMFCYNRSSDLLLGLPFNIASSALLLSIIAKATGCYARNLHLTLGDTHIYEQHIPQVKEQIQRESYNFPELDICAELNTVKDIEQLQFEHFKLINYISHEAIKAEMIP